MTEHDGTSGTPSPAPAVQPPDPATGAKADVVAGVSKMVSMYRSKFGPWRTFKAPPPRQQKSATDLAEVRTTLAVHRTLMGADRSLMAWIRTALSMVSFGFTIYKILQGFATSGGTLSVAGEPRLVGLFLIGSGAASILMGIMEYWHRAQELRAYEDVSILRPSFVMAVVIAVMSVALLTGVAFRAL